MNLLEYLNSTGWKARPVEGGRMSFSHAEHGFISIVAASNTNYNVMHAGKFASVGGKRGKGLTSLVAAINHSHEYIKAINEGRTAGNKLINIPSDVLEIK